MHRFEYFVNCARVRRGGARTPTDFFNRKILRYVKSGNFGIPFVFLFDCNEGSQICKNPEGYKMQFVFVFDSSKYHKIFKNLGNLEFILYFFLVLAKAFTKYVKIRRFKNEYWRRRYVTVINDSCSLLFRNSRIIKFLINQNQVFLVSFNINQTFK